MSATITTNHIDTINVFAVHFGEGDLGRFRGFATHRAAARFAHAYLRGNSAEAFARVYRIHYMGDGTVILTDNDGGYYREIPASEIS